MEGDKIIQFLLEPEFIGWLAILRVSFIVFSLILLTFIVYFLLKTKWLRRLYIWDLQEFFRQRPVGVHRLEKAWLKLKKRLGTGLESEYKLAIMEADAMLDEALKRMGLFGETLGEKLDKVTPVVLPNLAEIRQTHNLRNNIVHDPNYRLNLDAASKTINIYEKALSDLQVI